MIENLTRKWWVLLLRGVLGVFVGVIAFAMPGLAMLTMVLVWAVFAEVDGIAAIVMAIAGRSQGRSFWALTVAGIVGIAAGIVTWLWPGATILALLWVIALWAIARGVFQIIAAFELRKVIDREWLMLVSGLLSIAFGFMVIFRPVTGMLTVAFIIGVYACGVGLLEIALAFKVRQVGHRLRAAGGAAAA